MSNRASANYNKRSVKLDVVQDSFALAEPGQRIRGVYLRSLAVAGSVNVKVGRDGDVFPLVVNEGIEAEPFAVSAAGRLAAGPPITAGIFVDQPVAAGAGALATFLIIRDDEEGGICGPAFRVIR